MMPSHRLILCRPLLLLPSIFPSIRIFSSESVLHIRWPKYWSFNLSFSPSNESTLRIRWPKYWSFSFNISPSNEHSGLMSFRIDRFDLLAVQGTPKSLLQLHSSKASVLWHSSFLIVHLTSIHDYWKSHNLD